MKVSIIIPTKNGMPLFEQVLKAWINQEKENNVVVEILVIDSGSTDGTKEVCEKYNVNVIHINPEDFQHGKTRNIAFSKSSGEIVIYTVQDALPVNYQVLNKLLRHFKNPKVQAAIGRQIVPKSRTTNPLEWSECGTKFIVRDFSVIEINSNEKLYQLSHWDNVIAAYRRKALEENYFENISFGEDMVWALKAIKKKWTLVYDSTACVYHYHKFYFKRTFTITLLSFIHSYIYWDYKRKYNIFKTIFWITYKIFFELKPENKFCWYVYNLKLWGTKFLSFFSFYILLIFKDKAWLKHYLKSKKL